jgi:uncharacterized protein (DUF58 family)
MLVESLVRWLETRWVAPAYAGGVLLGLAIAFFGAAINSMAGWLYAISGTMLAIVLVSLWSPPRTFKGLQIHRHPIRPVCVGEPLSVEILLENTTLRPKVLLQARDDVPSQLGQVPTVGISSIAAQKQHRWTYTCYPTHRGLYHWQTLTLRTAAPFGLFWCRRSQLAAAHATVYPNVLPLTHCPLIDQMSMASGIRWQTSQQAQDANEGLTRAVRPYRWGDPTRLIHWRTSARYGELRVRELEELTADNQVLIGLDTGDRWTEDGFESAVVAAASLYIYSLRRQLSVAVWLPHIGVLQTKHTVLSALADVMPGQVSQGSRFPAQPMVWLSSDAAAPQSLPSGSVWLRWQMAADSVSDSLRRPTFTITLSQPLEEQLQSSVSLALRR